MTTLPHLVYIKQEELGAIGDQNEQENEKIDFKKDLFFGEQMQDELTVKNP